MYNPFTLENKIILVTGASSGIGRATAIECSRMGAKLIITARNEKRLQETLSMMEGEEHRIIVADLASSDGVDKVISELPVLDGLVNNAGIVDTLPVDFITEEKIHKTLDINTFAPILLLSALAKKRKIKKGGAVVFTSSISGVSIFSPGNALYSVSKAAVTAFAKNAALEYAPRKIRVNAVCPGMIDTSIYENSVITADNLAEDVKKYPMKRYGKPQEVAHAIVYLLSDGASFVTGSTLVIDGGYTLL